jgi:hypothetical protein
MKISKVKLKWNDYKIIRRMFPHGTTYPLEIISGIQLNTNRNRFPRGLCSLVTEFQGIVQDPLPYLARKVLPKLVNKHLGVRKKFKSIEEHEMKIPKDASPIFITNYLEEFTLTLSPFTKFGDPIYVTDIPVYHCS